MKMILNKKQTDLIIYKKNRHKPISDFKFTYVLEQCWDFHKHKIQNAKECN